MLWLLSSSNNIVFSANNILEFSEDSLNVATPVPSVDTPVLNIAAGTGSYLNPLAPVFTPKLSGVDSPSTTSSSASSPVNQSGIALALLY